MIFQTFDSSDIVAGRVQPVSTGLWANGEPIWTNFYTSSLQTRPTGSSNFDPLNGLYYTNVYDANPATTVTADIYFSVTYGHMAGSGSSEFDLNTNTGSLIKPTQAIYGQYRNLLLTPDDSMFTFQSGSLDVSVNVDSPDIYVINFKSDKVKDRLDAGQFALRISGSNGAFTFIDDSRQNSTILSTTGGKRFNIISGSLSSAYITGNTYQAVGSVYPDLGIIVLNPTALSEIVGNTSLGSLSTPASSLPEFAMMHRRLFSALAPNSNGSITARVTEYVPSRHYFIRIKNQNFNYSNNPSFVISNNESAINAGNLRFSEFSSDPKVFITTVGLYTESNDLVAVAKFSQPILKDFSNEILAKIKIDM